MKSYERGSKKHGFIRERISFLGGFIKNPKTVGSVIPSSPRLGKAMASFIKDKENETVIELGAGTGPITKALLKAGMNPKKLTPIEMNEKFVEQLRTKYPELNIVQGDASKMTEIFPDKVGKVDTIISGLPLKSIPKPIVDAIIEESFKMLKPDGIYVQFTYDLRASKSILLKQCDRIGAKIIMANIPPARVDAFRKRK